MRSSKLLLVFLLACITVLAGCNYSPSNVSTVQTTDCGESWTLIPTGQRVPSNTMSICSYNVQLPNYPMQGQTEFLTQFKGNVLVKVQIAYDYEIVDPIKYIRFAKFLGRKQVTSGDQEDANANNGMASKYETAENVVIDVRLRDVVTTGTAPKDIVTFNPSDFEAELYKKANEVLAERGVEMNTMTFVTLPEDQTRMAIDAATAMAVYESKGMGELGGQLVVARAGATHLNVNVSDAKQVTAE